MGKEHYIEKYYSTGTKNEFNIVTCKVGSRDPLLVIEERDLVGFRFFDKEEDDTNYSSMYYFGEHLTITDLILTSNDDFIRGLQLDYLNRLGIEEAIFCSKSGVIIHPVNKSDKTLDEVKIEEVTKSANGIFISQKDFIDRIVSSLEKHDNKVSMEVNDVPTPISDIVTKDNTKDEDIDNTEDEDIDNTKDEAIDNTKVNIRTFDLYIGGYKIFTSSAIDMDIEGYELCIKLGDVINSISSLYQEFPYLKYMMNEFLLELWNNNVRSQYSTKKK